MTTDYDVRVGIRELDSRRLLIVDGMFKPDVVRLLYEILKKLPFAQTDYDTEATKHLLHWKHEFSLDSFAENPLFKTWHARIVAKTEELFPLHRLMLGRVHCNNQPYGDIQHPHSDLVPGVTSLYFANPEWDDNWQGETVFYDGCGEPFYAVAPKPGRVLIFPGDVVHRGGVPSRACFEPRLSVAFKFSADAKP